jgi:hypothetical protein
MRNNDLILKFSFQQQEYSQIFQKMINFLHKINSWRKIFFENFSKSKNIIIFAEPGHELRCTKMVRHNNNLGFLWGVIEED